MIPYIVTYKFYNRKGQRYSIFGVYNQIRKGLDIYMIKCFNGNAETMPDQFTRKVAKEKFEAYLLGKEIESPANPETSFVFCKEDNSMRAMIDFCNANLYRKRYDYVYGTNVGIQIPSLYRMIAPGVMPETNILTSEFRRVKPIPYPVLD